MKEVLMYIVGSLVENSQSVKVGVSEDGNVMRFKLVLEGADRGKIIGKEGRVIKSIRSILQAVAAKQNKKVYLDID